MSEPNKRIVDPPSPLRECFKHCETRCVSGCCGLDAFSTLPDDITEWIFKVGPKVAVEARWQLSEFMEQCMDESVVITSPFLNAETWNEKARARLLEFLGAFHRTLDQFA